MAQQSNAPLDSRHPLTLQLHILSKPKCPESKWFNTQCVFTKTTRKTTGFGPLSPAVQLRLRWHLTMRVWYDFSDVTRCKTQSLHTVRSLRSWWKTLHRLGSELLKQGIFEKTKWPYLGTLTFHCNLKYDSFIFTLPSISLGPPFFSLLHAN